ncbi:hypothetical protein SteCoe_33807 [Stentor coeruleus]|uniref:Uncharacterized protein n=1 Tax=Stentor coeruleus TaxID=5963 RepID=A0A1R2AW45_9CILI|nr:hypothetical protein SteCoe_33807 [Stentor coeruleus]
MDAFLTEVLGEKAQEVKDRASARIWQELSISVKNLKIKLPEKSRCAICTLILPCNYPEHQLSQQSLPRQLSKKMSYWEISQKSDHLPLPNLRTLEKIDKYHESKIQLTKKELDDLKNEEQRQQIETKILEEKRLKHVQSQKRKIESYKQELEQRKKDLYRHLRAKSEKQKAHQAQLNKYLEKQRKKLNEPNEKTKCMIDFFKSP